MPKCYFNNDLKNGYPCEYTITDDVIKVEVEYDISDELKSDNGITVWSFQTVFETRDILIVDALGKKSYLLKNAYYSGMNSRMGTLDDSRTTSFIAPDSFISSSPQKLLKLDTVPKVQNVKMYSKAIIDYYRHPSVDIVYEENELIIAMSRNPEEQYIEVCKNNIKEIVLGDNWECKTNLSSVSIEIDGYLGIVLLNPVD